MKNLTHQIEPHPVKVECVTTEDLSDAKDWLQRKADEYTLSWLLAHANDGVIWGRMEGGRLITSHDAAQNNHQASSVCPPLRTETLQQARFFAEHAELFLWRDGDNSWHARLIRDCDEEPDFIEALDEPQILWGTDLQPLNSDFTLMSDGAQGLRHAVPLHVEGMYSEQARPLRLWVRHYVQEDETGFTRIVVSRLVALKKEQTK